MQTFFFYFFKKATNHSLHIYDLFCSVACVTVELITDPLGLKITMTLNGATVFNEVISGNIFE